MNGEQKHTPEPWGVDEAADTEHMATCLLENPTWIAIEDFSDNGGHVAYCAPENAHRITACVNYCAGMTDDQLTCDSAQIVCEELDRVVKQRDRLLEVLRLCYDHCRVYHPEVERNNVGETVRAAIAECQS